MKKSMITIAVISTVLVMTACGADAGTSASTAAETTTAAEPETTAEAQPDTDASAEAEPESGSDPFEEYIGQWESTEQWNGNDLYIVINGNSGSFDVEVSTHSAVADYLWDYSCTGSDDGTYIECTGGGTLNRTDYAPDGEMQEPETVYTDGTARFNIKGGTLFWEDCKEGTAAQVGFIRAE